MNLREITPHEDPRVRELTDEVHALRRQLRLLRERERSAFDRGFASATLMVENGADLEHLRGALNEPQALPVLARGTRDLVVKADHDSPTIPMRVITEG